MIPDKLVKQLFEQYLVLLGDEWETPSLLPAQFFRGITHNQWKNANPTVNCDRFFVIFENYNIIPRYCFNCYKVSVEPRTVVELFKLMLIFNAIKLPNDNTRKCTIEVRTEIAGTYKGLIYCQDLEDAKTILPTISEIIAAEISPDIPLSIKRGCSEYHLVYPEYKEFDSKGFPLMQYPDEWEEIEQVAKSDKLCLQSPIEELDSYTPKEQDSEYYFLHRDVKVMLNWLKYAATIGDLSYLDITDRHVIKIPNLNRPPFQAPV